MDKKELKTRRGSALLLTTILMFVILSMVVSLTYVTVMEQKMSQKTKSSVGAFYGAESGVEWALNKIAHSDGTDTIATAFTGNIVGQNANCPFGTDTCQVYFLGADGKVLAPATDTISEVKAVRSVGAQGGETQRAIEAAVAESGDYQIACVAVQPPLNALVCCRMKTGDGTALCRFFNGSAGFGEWLDLADQPW